MPELPEVETIVRQLKSKLENKTITQLEIHDHKVIDKNITKILPARITGIKRRGKSIIFKLEQNNLLIHLRMTGHFFHINNQDQSYKKYLSGLFKLNDGSFFTFNEIRRFGSVRLFSNDQLKKELSKLGPEPLEIKNKEFIALLKNYSSSVIKTKLLDQTCIVGIGNIYAQEMLYHAGINPFKKIKDISENKLKLLHQEMQKILLLAIQNNGTTVDNYSHLTGKGDFQNFLAVYDQTICPRKHELSKVKFGGRGTSYCKVCQK